MLGMRTNLRIAKSIYFSLILPDKLIFESLEIIERISERSWNEIPIQIRNIHTIDQATR